ncbi:MAG: TonB-dependent receptor [Bacteroidota bacterium]
MTKQRTNFLQLALLLICLFTSSFLQGQERITGIVTDKDNTPLIGVNVVETGTTNGTITDVDGSYELTIDGNSLTFSYTGFETQKIKVNGQQAIDVTLSEGALLDEVVVVGYGKEKKSTLTGAVASIDNKQLTVIPSANTANLLAGRVPGVMTRQNTGLPGGEATQIRIRGFQRPPLVLVDGVQMDFARIDPNDIESITILKDAAAAVYGARAGNGVVLVTTKRGTTGKPQVSFSSSFALQSATQFMQQVNTEQYIELVRESNLLDGGDPDATFTEEDLEQFRNKEPGYEGGDWTDALIKNNAPMQQYNLSVSGGSEAVKFFTSLGLTDQESYFRSRDYDYGRINVRSNIDANINENLSVTLDLSYRQEETNRAYNDGDGNGLSAVWTDLLSAQPVFPTELPDPSVGQPFSGFSQRNPLTLTNRDVFGTYDREEDVFRGRLALNLKIPFIPGLTARAEANVQRYDRRVKRFRKTVEMYQYLPETDTYSLEGIQNPVTSISESQFSRTQLYPLISLEYARTFGDHNFKVLALAEQITRTQYQFGAGRINLLTTAIPELFVGNTDTQTNFGGSSADIGRKSAVGRLNYTYQDRYLFEATFRADGNVLFAPETRWGYFPSFSFGWVLSEESFLSSSGALDFLKLRASYSQLGDDSANGLAGFDYLTGYTLNGIYLLGNSEGQPRITTLGLVNPFLTWEEITMYNLGLEATFFDGRLSAEVEVFYRERAGIIAANTEDVPSTFGAQLPVVNLNSQNNRGIEISALYQQKLGEFRLDIAPNFSWARARWDEVKSQEDFDDPDLKRLFQLDGQWLNRTVGYVSDGIFMSQDEIDSYGVIQDGNENTTLRPGDIRYKDLNGDGIIDFRDQDEIAYGRQIPEMVMGLNLDLYYKNFRLSALFQGASNFAINIGGAARTMFSNGTIPFTYQYDFRWQPDPNDPTVNINPDASLPAAAQAAGPNNNRNSDFWVKDVNYLRLKNVNLAYSLPSKVLSKAKIDNLEVYVAGENLFLWSNLGIYKNAFDPEFDASRSPQRNFPITRSIAFGLRASL